MGACSHQLPITLVFLPSGTLQWLFILKMIRLFPANTSMAREDFQSVLTSLDHISFISTFLDSLKKRDNSVSTQEFGIVGKEEELRDTYQNSVIRLGDGSVGKVLSKHEDPSLDPQNPRKT